MYLNHDVWINTEDSCTVGWPITHWEDCPVEDSSCTVASVGVVADVVYQVVVQRIVSWMKKVTPATPCEWTRRTSSARA
jgi:hypothetical protein